MKLLVHEIGLNVMNLFGWPC